MVLGGILFATSASSSVDTKITFQAQDLPGLIRERSGQVYGETQQVAALRREVDELTRSQGSGNSRLTGFTRDADALAPSVGLQAVEGPALKVTLDDAKMDTADLPEGYTVDDIVVHQQDVQGVVNALWQGGAEAMMIQDQRVVSTSAVRCVGNTLILQGRVYSPPFTITALGDQDSLRRALDASPEVSTYREYVDLLGLGWKVEDLGDQVFPAYDGPVNLASAQSGQGGPDSEATTPSETQAPPGRTEETSEGSD